MKNKANINNSSIDSAGLPKDYMEAIAELVWNGFDAKATEVNITFEANQIDHIDKITVSDNGEGIKHETLHDTFGSFLDSLKKNSFQRSSYIRGKKGKGRFSFATFSARATWHTVYRKDNNFIEYDIVITKNKKNEFEDKNTSVSKRKKTGTSVILEELFGVTAFSFTNQEFYQFLAREFGWFLFLNKENNYSLKINGTPIEYENIIADNEVKKLTIADEGKKSHNFLITYIRWKENIGDRYYYYFLNEEKRESAKKLTSFNNNAIDFHHSVYVQSNFFNDFVLVEGDPDVELFNINHNSPVFKALLNHLSELLNRKQKEYIRENGAEELVTRMEDRGVFPVFRKDKYDRERKKDLIKVVKELYCVEPRIFKGLKREQEITFIGFLNLLLDSDERENILIILEGLVQLTTQERSELSKVLKKTSFSRIVNTIKLIENRFKAIELLKALVFDLKKFTTERAHIQKIVENNYWMFGEEYHIAGADDDFENLLSNYLYIIDGITEKQEIKSYDSKKRPDIFLCRQRNIPDSHDSQYTLEENIMVELKRPTVAITKKEFRQIDDYLDFILKQDAFNSQLRIWKFYLISNTVDDYIVKQYDAFKDKGKRFLVQQAGRYEIYAMTWDDLFKTFDIKHRYLLEKLNFDKKSIRDELLSKGIKLDKESADEITEEIINLKNGG